MSTPKLYTSQMLSLKRGYALFDPHPGYDTRFRSRPRVRFGDAGYVTEAGAFRRLFNVHLPPGHPEQATKLPEQFEQLPTRPERFESRNFPPGQLRSMTAQHIKTSGGLSL
jgi:hypothetical protein